ncbi:MAG: tRNA (N6-isopentenyl adenosine(37)-C2)-methylthiotransferase MiaB [Lachnospiraceae bacterium]|nr:tRNA (N6-isopentenyl adenosine(37)-C2)-methylthiotransferase MiaB [Lachnospiraceae bacterium]
MNEAETILQFEYMKKLKELNVLRERPPKFIVNTFGCQMNERDSEKLEGILLNSGYERSDSEEEADLVIYNTCTVRENADKRLYGRLGVLKSLKDRKPELKVALCGCMMQEETVIDKIRKSYSYVDLIFGTHNIFKFAELLYTVLESGEKLIDIWKETDEIVEDLPSRRKYSFKSGVNIMFGCNNFCTYCIVPYVRGRERSRSSREIIREIETLSADGVKEVMLLGQNVNSYGKGLDGEPDFAGLLKEVEKIEGIERIRFMTSHPKDLSDELIDVMASSDKICRHLHLPLQSGSSRLLREMNRHYTKEGYLTLVEKIRSKMPDIAITTDIIVGFPTETEEDIEDTIDVIKTAQFEGAFTFEYSKRTGTPAALMDGQIPKEVVQPRFDRVLKCVQETAAKRSERFTGQVAKVLVESLNERDSSMVTGRLSQNITVHLEGDSSMIGRMVSVELQECKGFYYLGKRIG